MSKPSGFSSRRANFLGKPGSGGIGGDHLDLEGLAGLLLRRGCHFFSLPRKARRGLANDPKTGKRSLLQTANHHTTDFTSQEGFLALWRDPAAIDICFHSQEGSKGHSEGFRVVAKRRQERRHVLLPGLKAHSGLTGNGILEVCPADLDGGRRVPDCRGQRFHGGTANDESSAAEETLASHPAITAAACRRYGSLGRHGLHDKVAGYKRRRRRRIVDTHGQRSWK
jgi:hypothetical protein